MFPLALLNPSPPAVDPASLTLVLLHFDGTDNSTVFADSSVFNRTYTSNNAVLSTTQFKFDNASLSVSSNAFDRIQNEDYTGFWELGTSNYTAEMWFYQKSLTSSLRGIFSITGDSDTQPIGILTRNNGDVVATFQKAGGGLLFLTHQNKFTAGSFFHVALVRNGAEIALYLNGIKSNTTYNIGTESLKTGAFRINIGACAAILGDISFGLNGYIDEFRLRKEAVYTGNFTPPTAPFTY